MRKRGLIAGTAIAALMVYVTGPSRAQDEGGLRVSLGVSQNFGVGDNLALGVPGSPTNPEEGRSALSSTSFALQVSSITRTQAFNFQVGGSARFGSTPAGNTLQTGFVDPFVVLSYDREGANARFSFDAEYYESDISRPRPLWDFTDEDNVITPPSDLASLPHSSKPLSPPPLAGSLGSGSGHGHPAFSEKVRSELCYEAGYGI